MERMMDHPFGNTVFSNPLASSSQSRQSTTRQRSCQVRQQ